MRITLTDAVNLCLRGIGRAPVANADDPDLDAATALATIKTVSKTVQSKGWYFNREGNWNLTPDSSGNIYAPNNAIDIISAQCSRYAELTMRGNRIYDKASHSYYLGDLVNKNNQITFVFITELPFEELPVTAANAIQYIARRQFAQDVEGDSQNWQFNKFDEDNAWAMLQTSESRNKKNNYLRNPEVANFMGQVQGQNGGLGMYEPINFPRKRNN